METAAQVHLHLYPGLLLSMAGVVAEEHKKEQVWVGLAEGEMGKMVIQVPAWRV